MKPGTQITYIPNHVDNDPHHPDCEDGFIVRQAADGVYFCRFFNKDGSLRTVANSERCDEKNLVKNTHHTDGEIAFFFAACYGVVPEGLVK